MKDIVKKTAGILLAAIVGALALTAGTAQGYSRINGLADEHIGLWQEPSVNWFLGFNEMRFVRHIVPWDIALRPSEYPGLETWLNGAAQLRRNVMISFGPSGSCVGTDRNGTIPADSSVCTPAPDVYLQAVHQFRVMWPQVTEFTAWNEPNHRVVDANGRNINPLGTGTYGARRAAQYWFELASDCRTPVSGTTCQVAAGDFTDTDDLPGYSAAYKTQLSNYSIAPPAWAVHGYGLANNNFPAPIQNFANSVNGTPVWITEVGAYYCRNWAVQGEQSQRTAARLIVQAGAYIPQIERIYYYSMNYAISAENRSSTSSCREKDETSLTTREFRERPALNVIRHGVPATLSLYKNGTWMQRFHFVDTTLVNRAFTWGQAGEQPVLGDWDGDGVKSPGVFVNGTWWLTNDPKATDTSRNIPPFNYGSAGDTALVGDWNRDGIDTVGVRGNQTFYLRNSNTTGIGELVFSFGDPGDPVVVGDWNGDGFDSVGVFKSGQWWIKNTSSGSNADDTWPYGSAGDKPLVGDWNGDGRDDPGVYRGINGAGIFFLGQQHQTSNLFSIWSWYADGSETPLAG